MDSDESNNVTKNIMDDAEDLFGSDEGIVNFLSDAIGQDVGTEVLREFSHSDAFAELLDVVTSSLVPSGATSRRQSRQDSDVVTDQLQSDEANATKRLEVKVSSINYEQNISGASENFDEEKSNKNSIVEESTRTDFETFENTDDENHITTPTAHNIQKDRQIQNRLKICLKVSSSDKKSKMSSKNKTNVTRKSAEANKLGHDMNKTAIARNVSNKCGVQTNSPTKSNNSVAKVDKIRSAELKSYQKLHKKCTLVHRDEEFKKYSIALKLKPCCVIMWDLLYMGSTFRENNCLGGGGDASLSFVSVKNVVIMTETKIEETNSLEEIKRQCFAKKLSPNELTVVEKIVQKSSPVILPINESSKAHNTLSDVVKASEKEYVETIKKQENREISISSSINKRDRDVTLEEPRKNRNEIKRSNFDLEDLEEETRPQKGRNRSEEGDRNSICLETDANSSTENENECKDKNQQFGRRRDKDDVRARKFDKFEYERNRKFTENRGEKTKKETKETFKPHDPFRQGKTLSNSFKIPKKHTYDLYGRDDRLKVSTPLAKQDIPSENLKFERFKKGLSDEKDTFKKRDWVPRNNRRYEPRAKLDFDVSNNKVLPLPVEDNVAEIEPTWEDEDEGGGSIFGDKSTDSPLPPLTEVQAGDLAVEVTELLRDGLKVDIPNMEDFPCATDTTAQKCAWWFSKTEKEPPSEKDNLFQKFEDAPSFKSDNESNCSFVGNISNPGTEADCQVNEISSTNRFDIISSEAVRDPDKVDEYCGRSLLQAKIRIATSEKFQNIFDLRSGALYEKENFQAKCNLCNQLIVGKRELAVHVRGATHKRNLKQTDPHSMDMDASTDDVLSTTSGKNSMKSNSESHWDDKIENQNTTVQVKKETEESDSKNDSKDAKNENGRKEENAKDSNIAKERKGKKSNDTSPKKNGKKDKDPTDLRQELVTAVKKERIEMVYERTSTGLAIKVPATGSAKRRSRSPGSPTRLRSKNQSRSRSRERRRRKSRSPVRRIPRSPTQFKRSSRRSRSRSPIRRSRSRSPGRGSRKHRATSEEKVKAFLARTRRSRSRSPANGYHSKRCRRTRTRSRSPQISMKKDNREFHEKLALTADGKWDDEMEKRWKLMEAEEAMFREQFYDRRKAFTTSPEEHPKYAEEWTQFWERRYQEVEQSGKNPEAHDFVMEWKEFWSKRLNSLLQEEADNKIAEIKKNYGMDFVSLSQLRISGPKVIIKTEPVIVMPMSVPPPIQTVLKRETIIATPASSDKASLEDFATRSMSISDGDSTSTCKNKDVKQPPERKPSVTVEDFKSQWEFITREKVAKEFTGSLTDGLIIAPVKQESSKRAAPDFETVQSVDSKRRNIKNRSEAASSSEASYDFDGFDLVQVLRLMCNLEDQLSFLAPKVLEYFKMAEEMELAKNRGSHTLLDNEELVTVLFQSRDRFMTMIRSNILAKDVLKSLNLTVYALNAILDAPQCQKFRPQAPIIMPILETPVVELKIEQRETDPTAVTATIIKKESEEVDKKPLAVDCDPNIVAGMAHVPFEKKKTIAAMIAKYLVAHGRENIGDKSLQEFLRKILAPVIQLHAANRNAERLSIPHQMDLRGNVGMKSELFNEPQTSNLINTDFEFHSASSRLHGVSSSRVIGSALPQLPSISTRRAVEADKISLSNIDNRSIDTNTRPVSVHRESRRSPTPSGRRSPFSRRDYTGNPVANQRLN